MDERDEAKLCVKGAGNWPVSKDKLSTKYYKNFKEFTHNISKIKL
jgi:hypothetical protein